MEATNSMAAFSAIGTRSYSRAGSLSECIVVLLLHQARMTG